MCLTVFLAGLIVILSLISALAASKNKADFSKIGRVLSTDNAT
jgi:hypothetical protein